MDVYNYDTTRLERVVGGREDGERPFAGEVVDDGGRVVLRDGDRGEGVAALELRDAGLQDVRGGVTDAGVNVAELLEREQVGGVLGVLELWVSE